MQTVNFQCGHCGKLMAVGAEFLGQQVRCPHCQQVVVAPPPAPAAGPGDTVAQPPAPVPPPPELGETVMHVPAPSGEPEDIFAPPPPPDDLFGQPEPPRLEFPPDPLAPTIAEAPAPAPAPEATVTATAPYLPSDPAATHGDGTALLPSGDGGSPWIAGAVTEMLPPSTAEAPPEHEHEPFVPSAPSAPRAPRRSGSGTPWFMILVFSPLLLYSIVVTVFAVLLYRHQAEVEEKFRNRLEMLPDDGDNPGVQPKGKKVTKVYRYDPKLATQPLPDHLITTLGKNGGEPIRIGDLQITPRKVVRERVKVYVQNHEKPEPCTGDSLVLYMDMKNLSSEYAFAPLDNYFDRYWKPGTDQLPPFTQLEAGDKYRFYGGPAHWYPRGDNSHEREWVEGRKPFEPELLQPGEEKPFFVCTDGEDAKALHTLFGDRGREPYHGPLLWRVRVRRGLVKVGDKEYPATAVVGIKFTDKDVREVH